MNLNGLNSPNWHRIKFETDSSVASLAAWIFRGSFHIQCMLYNKKSISLLFYVISTQFLHFFTQHLSSPIFPSQREKKKNPKHTHTHRGRHSQPSLSSSCWSSDPVGREGIGSESIRRRWDAAFHFQPSPPPLSSSSSALFPRLVTPNSCPQRKVQIYIYIYISI